MNVDARWIVKDGQRYVRIKVPGPVIAVLTPEWAMELSVAITKLLMTKPPAHDDDGGHSY